MAAELKKEYSLFEFLELISLLIANKEKDRVIKSIADIPKEKMKLIEECGDRELIHSFDDYINWILDFVYSYYNEDKLLWLHLALGNNQKLLEDIATGNKIPITDLHIAISKRMLKDLEENFDTYADYSEVTFERILKKSVDDN
jgi:hypothetical protein